MLECPNCRHPLVRCQNEWGNFWHCNDCQSSAATLSLLRKFVDRATMNRLWQNARQFEYPRLRDCPGCHNPMEEIPVSTPVGDHALDVCDRCHFVWLDAGEWAALPQAAIEDAMSADPIRNASPALQEKIAIERIRRIGSRSENETSSHSYEWWQWLPGFFRLPVETRQPSAGATPVATWGLAGLVLILSLLAFGDLATAVQNFGLIPAETTRLGGFTFISSFFLHAGLMHLLGNLYFLITFGDNVEHFLGPFKYLALVAAATIGGGLFHLLIDPTSTTPCIGASGGISGVMTFYALRFPAAKLSMLIFWFIPQSWVSLSARWMFALWILYQFVVLWQQSAGYSNVSGAAHLGGVVVGFCTWLITRTPHDSSKGSIFER